MQALWGRFFLLVVCLVHGVNEQTELDKAQFVLARIWLPDLAMA